MTTAKLSWTIALLLASVTRGYVIKIDSPDGDLETYHVRGGNLTAEEFLSDPQRVNYRHDIQERDRPCGGDERHWYEIVGDGNPHQNYKIGQVADTMISCSPGATTATGKEHTFGWSFGGDFSSAAFDFATVGFSVEESDSKSVQQTFQCGADGMSEICVLHYTAVTAVTVQFKQSVTDCGGTRVTDLGTGVVFLPNANSVGSTIARGTNFGDRDIIQCRGSAEREVDFFCGPPGGPEFFDTNAVGPWTDAYLSSYDHSTCGEPPIEAFHFLD